MNTLRGFGPPLPAKFLLSVEQITKFVWKKSGGLPSPPPPCDAVLLRGKWRWKSHALTTALPTPSLFSTFLFWFSLFFEIVEPYRLCEAMRKLREDTNREIRQFSSKLNCLCLRIRRKHKQELYTLNLMKKSYPSGQGHRNWTELTEIDKNKSVSL